MTRLEKAKLFNENLKNIIKERQLLETENKEEIKEVKKADKK